MITDTDLSSPSIADCGMYRGSKPGFPLHSHPMWEVTIQCHGNIKTHQAEDTIDTHPGTILLHRPNLPHQDVAGDSYTVIYVKFYSESLTVRQSMLYDNADRSIEATCRTIVKEWYNDMPDRDEMLESLSRQLVILIGRSASMPSYNPSQQIVGKASGIIEERFNQTLTFKEICNELSVSTGELRKEFIKVRGQTPFEYLQAVRLQHAIASLYTSNLKLDSIAALNGFSSASHLSRQIKDLTGCSPGQLRKR